MTQSYRKGHPSNQLQGTPLELPPFK